MEEELTPTQVESVLITLAVVVVLLGLIFHSWVGGILALAPLVVTILVNFGVMGFLEIGLDSFTAMVASIAIGLGIDYAIHFTHRLRKELAKRDSTILSTPGSPEIPWWTPLRRSASGSPESRGY